MGCHISIEVHQTQHNWTKSSCLLTASVLRDVTFTMQTPHMYIGNEETA